MNRPRPYIIREATMAQMKNRDRQLSRHPADLVPDAWHQLPDRPCDSSKSTRTDAIDLCRRARRNVQFRMRTSSPRTSPPQSSITLTPGDLDDQHEDAGGASELHSSAGYYANTGARSRTQTIGRREVVLCLDLTVASDLEPSVDPCLRTAAGQAS